ncbi:MAG: hypothetical protein II915_02475 [Eubacterium sp.]|nr:hypothetical protein [Eubacterium sp.]MBQ7200112.1 hypothetical protein [Eubacterium sp.]MBR0118885.1 hypothetical protein [Eubacterium sp.]
MMDRLVAIRDKLLAFWNRYTTKQKTIIICVALAILFAIVLLAYFLTRPVYVDLVTLNADAASEFREQLDAAGVDYEDEAISTDRVRFRVEQGQYSDAVVVMGANQITDSEGMSWEDALQEDMTTTSQVRSAKIDLALQSSIRTGLLTFDGVEDATVYLSRQEDDMTVFAEKAEAYVSASLKLAKGYEMDQNVAMGIAYYIANAVGNKTTDNIIITDTTGNLLYGSKEDNTLGGSVTGVNDYREKLQNTFAKNVETMLRKAGWDDVEIGKSAIKFRMDKIEELVKTYTANEGMEQGLYSHSYNYKSTGQSGTGGIPGTDSNGDLTDYPIVGTGSTNTETTLDKYDYLPNETVRNIEYEVGAVVPEESSIGIILTHYNILHEETLQEQGMLDEISFDEYVEQNSAATQIELPNRDELIELVSAATGIATGNIDIMAYDQPVYEAAETGSFFDNITNYLMVILTVLIAILLIFVIIRGTSPVEVTETEPELSVEDLLESTRDDHEALDEIELEDKSETRIMIEKFVDENPEAVALLLRNWINEDWGG